MTEQNAPANQKTLGSLFAGIGGFDLGFERAGWRTAWQVELSERNRAVLADRLPGAIQLPDVRSPECRQLPRVDCIAFGSPCTDISNMGARRIHGKRGLEGAQSRLFFEALEIIDALQPAWLVFENVAALLHSNHGRDLERVVSEFARRDYLGFARVLDAQYFGVPQKRRRLFLVAGLGRYPSFDFLADAAPVEAIPCSTPALEFRAADSFAGFTLTARAASSQISLGCELLVAEPHGWHQMVERERATSLHGFLSGLDAANAAEAWSAGNAVCPQVAQWIAELLNRS